MERERLIRTAIDQVFEQYCKNNASLKLETLAVEKEKLFQYFYQRNQQSKTSLIEELVKKEIAYLKYWLEFYKISGMSASIALNFGPELYFYLGTCGDTELPIDEQVSWDIASISKLFTNIHALLDWKFNYIQINKPINQINPNFHYGCTILELLNFYYELRTHPRIDVGNCDSKEALKLLQFASTEAIGVHTYSDIPHMIYSRLAPNFKEHFTLYFNTLMGLSNTGYEINSNQLKTGNDYRYPDEIRDKKARICDYSGHAGIWSNSKDLVRFFHFLSRKTILTSEDLALLTTLLTNDNYPRAMLYRQTGLGLYQNSEVPRISSDTAFAASGSTGCWLIMDLKNGYTINILTNPYSSKNGIPARYTAKLNDLKYSLMEVTRKLQIIVKINQLEEQKEFLQKEYVLK